MTTPTLPQTFIAGDQLPLVTGFIEDTDLTGYTVTLHLEQPDGTVIDREATIIDATSGTFEIAWEAGDLVAGLGQRAEIEFLDQQDRPLTSSKFLIDVEAAV